MIKNTLFMFASTSMRFINNAVLLIVLARCWGPEVFGKFMYPATIAGIVVIFVDYGFNLQLVTDVGKNAKNVHMLTCRALTVKTLLAALLFVFGFPLLFLINTFDGYRTVLILLSISNVLHSYGVLFNLSFRGMGLFHQEAKTVFGATSVTVFLLGLLIWLNQGPEVIALGLLITNLIFMGYSWFVYYKIIDKAPFIFSNFVSILTALRKGFPFAIHVALGVLYFSVDTIIIEFFLGPEKVGIYQAGLRVVLGGCVLSDVLSSVYLTKLAKASTNQQSLVSSAITMTRHLLIIAALGFVCMIGFPEIIVKLLYGNNDFDNLIFLMPIFGIVMLIRIMGNSYGIVLTVNEKQVVRTVGAGLSVIVSIVMNLILIPKYGLQGAIYASIITHVFLVSIYVLFARLQTGSLLIDRRSMFVIAVVVATGLVKFTLFPESNLMTYTVAVCIGSSIGIIGVTTQEFCGLMKKSQIFSNGKIFKISDS